MRRNIWGDLLPALIMMGVGIVILSFAMAFYGPDLFKEENYMEKTHTINDKVTFLKISDAECDVRIRPSEDGVCRVVCPDGEKVFRQVTLDGQTLTVTRVDERKWYEHIGISWGWKPRAVTVYLPEGAYKDLTLKTASGTIDVPAGYAFSSVKITTASGDISFSGDVEKSVEITTASGDVSLSDLQVASLHFPGSLAVTTASGEVSFENCGVSGTFTASTASGDVEVTGGTPTNMVLSTVSGDVSLNKLEVWGSLTVSTTSGEISFDWLGAHEDIEMTTVSGDVKGTVAGDFRYSVKTTSGDIRVPADGGSGSFTLKTTSGDVNIVSLRPQ